MCNSLSFSLSHGQLETCDSGVSNGVSNNDEFVLETRIKTCIKTNNDIVYVKYNDEV